MNGDTVAEQMLLVLLSFLLRALYHFQICQHDLWPRAASLLGDCYAYNHKQAGNASELTSSPSVPNE